MLWIGRGGVPSDWLDWLAVGSAKGVFLRVQTSAENTRVDRRARLAMRRLNPVSRLPFLHGQGPPASISARPERRLPTRGFFFLCFISWWCDAVGAGCERKPEEKQKFGPSTGHSRIRQAGAYVRVCIVLCSSIQPMLRLATSSRSTEAATDCYVDLPRLLTARASFILLTYVPSIHLSYPSLSHLPHRNTTARERPSRP